MSFAETCSALPIRKLSASFPAKHATFQPVQTHEVACNFRAFAARLRPDPAPYA